MVLLVEQAWLAAFEHFLDGLPRGLGERQRVETIRQGIRLARMVGDHRPVRFDAFGEMDCRALGVEMIHGSFGLVKIGPVRDVG